MKNYCLILGAFFAIFPITPANSAGSDEIVCVDVTPPPQAEEAFAAYCGRCHEANTVAATFFKGVSRDSTELREIELARFLDRHSACPHRFHEDIADWLREMAGASGIK